MRDDAHAADARRRPKGQRGQAMPLAAIGLFMMCLGVLATLNLGQAVHQKIKLQNTADSAAYTLAAMEARTFNYIAFLNRAQIAHYNTAMMVQSYISWVGFQVGLYGTAVDLLETLRDAFRVGLSWPCKGPGCPYKAAKGPVFMPMQSALKAAKATRKAALAAYHEGGKIGHDIVEAMAIFNARATWQSQFARAALLNNHIVFGMQSYISKLDPDIGITSGPGALLNMGVNAALNTIEYSSVFDRSSGVNAGISLTSIGETFSDFSKLSQNEFMISLDGAGKTAAPKKSLFGGGGDEAKPEDAYRVMAELCNASRTPEFVSNRREPGAMATATSSGPAQAAVFVQKMGQTKMTKDGNMSGAKISSIYSSEAFPVGKYLSSDDYAESGQGTGSASPAWLLWTLDKPLGDAIAAYEENGKHLMYVDGGKGKQVKGQLAVMPPTTLKGVRFGEENHAPWPGFAAFMKFKPNKDRTADYGQPSTWVFLNKHHSTFQSEGQVPWHQNFSFSLGGETATLDTTIGGKGNSYMFEGLNALSRGMAYYHRPGTWAEHPNFFNPFWRARLAPVGQKLMAFWDRYVGSKITSKSESKLTQGAVNFLRNAQMDLFMTFITSVITH